MIQKKRKKRMIAVMFFSTALMMTGISFYGIREQMLEYEESEKYYEDFVKEAVKNKKQKEKEADDLFPERVLYEDVPIEVDFDYDCEGAFESAEDVQEVGWIYGPDTPIHYPIGYSGDNTYFLTHTLDGSEKIAGSVFLDGRCQTDFSDPHSILYGHCMRNGSMFGSLLKYKNQSYYEKHPFLWLITPETSYQLCIFSVYVANSEEEKECWRTEFKGRGDSRMESWLMETRSKSLIEPRYEVPEDARIITLSTCSYEFGLAKCLVVGFLVPVEAKR